MACSHENTPNQKYMLFFSSIPTIMIILNTNRGNLCNLSICNIYVTLNQRVICSARRSCAERVWYLVMCGIHDSLVGNLGNLNKCVDVHLYGQCSNLGCAHDVQLFTQISSCGRCSAGIGCRGILPIAIKLTGQVLQRLLLSHGYVEHRPNMQVCRYGWRVVCRVWIHRGLDVFRSICHLVTFNTTCMCWRVHFRMLATLSHNIFGNIVKLIHVLCTYAPTRAP